MKGVVYLSPADKYHRFTRRLPQGQKGLEERTIWHHGGPLNRVDVLEAGRANARRLLRRPPVAVPHHHFLLTDLLAGATAARETAAPRAASRRDPSGQRPWRASEAATAWPSPCPWSAEVGARAVVNWHATNKSCNRWGTGKAGGVSRCRFCTASSPAVRPQRHGGGS